MRQVFEMFFNKSFNSQEQNNKARCFVALAGENKVPVFEISLNDWDSLLHYRGSQQNLYWTPNTFYKDKRYKDKLRWLNCFFADIDIKDNPGLTFPDLVDRINNVGLPAPSMVIKTPSGGFHVYWSIEPARATTKATKYYEDLTCLISREIGGDLQAVGAERYMRYPQQTNILLFEPGNRYTFQDFIDWSELNGFDEARPTGGAKIRIIPKGILQHPAFQKLLRGVEEGIRDNTCFTIALGLRAEGYDQAQAQSIIQEWNRQNSPQLPLRTVISKIRSAYSGRYRGPASKWVTLLSGIPFSYTVFSNAKPRGERQRTHISEWEKDILALLEENNGTWTGSQTELAQTLSAPVRSVKEALKRLVQGVKISLTVEGAGRGAKTIITQIKASESLKVLPKSRISSIEKAKKIRDSEKTVHTHIHPNGAAAPVFALQTCFNFSLRGSPG